MPVTNFYPICIHTGFQWFSYFYLVFGDNNGKEAVLGKKSKRLPQLKLCCGTTLARKVHLKVYKVSVRTKEDGSEILIAS